MTENFVEGGCFERVVYVRVCGLATMRLAPPVSEFLKGKVGEQFARFIFDLDRCEGLDSTFMGVMAGVALERGRGAAGVGAAQTCAVSVVNVTERCYRQMEGLGLTRILDVRPEEMRFPQVKVEVISREAGGVNLPVVKASHENLVKADPKNEAKFGPFLKDLG